MYAPGYPPNEATAAPTVDARSSPNISPTRSPSYAATQHPPRARPRPNSALGHRTTSSLSSLAQLGLHLPPAQADDAHTPRTPFQENRDGAARSAAAARTTDRATSPSKQHTAQYRVQRSNSILARSPSLAAGQWGAFNGPHTTHAHSHSPAVGREYEDVQNRTFCKWSVSLTDRLQ